MSALFLGICIALSCQQSKPTEKAAPEKPVVNEDELVMRLSVDLVAEPQTQWEQERNDIINYAIDNLLDVKATSSGLYYQILAPGQGDSIRWAEQVRVHYRGYFLDGKEFDSSYKRGKPIDFYVGNMIDGWNEGLKMLRPGAKALFIVPSHLGYRDKGLNDAKGQQLVPPNTVLVFELEVLEKL
ncbi:MAG: FKBP-type peptidyl-prolyl cis-trans isomerase [Saprospiraceae bacterium]|nr:FKBP-type peptidyl-prolyl cis-trans isomerase [Saprospiraceae bacterium]